jgi:hypothetical protein
MTHVTQHLQGKLTRRLLLRGLVTFRVDDHSVAYPDVAVEPDRTSRRAEQSVVFRFR